MSANVEKSKIRLSTCFTSFCFTFSSILFLCIMLKTGNYWSSLYTAAITDNRTTVRVLLGSTLLMTLGLSWIIVRINEYATKSTQDLPAPRGLIFSILLLNVFLLTLGQLLSYGDSPWKWTSHIGFTYGNFQDFFYLLRLSSGGHPTDDPYVVGYFPFSFLIGKILSTPLQSLNNIYICNFWYYAIYASMITSVLLSAYFQARKNISNRLDILIYFSLFLVSYPFWLLFERGNFVLFSFIFLSLSLAFKDRSWLFSAFLAAFMALKVLNCVILLPLFLSNMRSRVLNTILFFISINVLTTIILHSGGMKMDYSSLITTVFASKIPFTDTSQLTAHSTFYSLYRTVSLMFFEGARQYDLFARTVLVGFGAVIGLCGLFSWKNWSFEFSALYFLCVLFLFHHASTEMNLVLLFPFVLSALSSKETRSVSIVSILLPIFLFTHQFIFFAIRDPGTQMLHFASLKTILILSAMSSFLLLALWDAGFYIKLKKKFYLTTLLL